MWFDDSGKLKLCEAGFSGFSSEPIKPCFSTFSGLTTEESKK